MAVSQQITSYCSKCYRSPGNCGCKNNPPIICGTCQKPTAACQCDPDQLFRRCDFCYEFKASDWEATLAKWVCPSCLNKEAVKFQIKKAEEKSNGN
jgi:hypothetical protein